MNKKPSGLIRIYCNDKDKLNTLQLLLSLQQKKAMTKVEALHHVLEFSLSNIIKQ